MRELAVIAVAGAFGSLSRYGLNAWAQQRFGETFPHGTLLVNVLGSFVLGTVLGLAVRGKLGRLSRLGVGTGFLGAFTTFSTFSTDTVALLRAGRVAAAGGNVLLNVGLGLIAAGVGFFVATKFD